MSNNDDLYKVGTYAEMKEHFGWTAARWRPPTLDPANIPENLHDLIPMAFRWGILNCAIRDDIVHQASEDELNNLKSALAKRHSEIEDFLYADYGSNDTEEQSTFMYMLILEMEYLDGPGIRGQLDHAIHKFKRIPSPENRAELAAAFDKISTEYSSKPPHYQEDEFLEARNLLGFDD